MGSKSCAARIFSRSSRRSGSPSAAQMRSPSDNYDTDASRRETLSINMDAFRRASSIELGTVTPSYVQAI